ncbi:hypothetical protein ACFXOQ_35730, partial [Streptomyces californicus]|uniref:hypothetical protein n=1 Tax=Streptomyces californicus TaxID=67351 RepID=UPI00368BAFD2
MAADAAGKYSRTIMATYFDPKSWSLAGAVDLGKRLLDPSWIDQWLGFTTSWADPVADLGSGTVTALMPDVLMTVLSEGIFSRFGGREVSATLLGHDLTATLDTFKVRRRGALIDWVDEQNLDWKLRLDEQGRIVATHRTRKMSAVVDAQVYDNLLTIDIRRASWYRIRLPRRVVQAPALLLDDLPNRASISYAHRRGDVVKFRIE